MASLLIRSVDEALHRRLKASAASHQRSLEEEARELLRGAVARQDRPARENLADVAQRLFGRKGGIDLVIAQRGDAPKKAPLDFSDESYGAAKSE